MDRPARRSGPTGLANEILPFIYISNNNGWQQLRPMLGTSKVIHKTSTAIRPLTWKTNEGCYLIISYFLTCGISIRDCRPNEKPKINCFDCLQATGLIRASQRRTIALSLHLIPINSQMMSLSVSNTSVHYIVIIVVLRRSTWRIVRKVHEIY